MIARVGLVVVVTAASAHAGPVAKLSSVAMAGPFKTIGDACSHATPCGGTEIDPKDPFNVVKPPSRATCDLDHDLNALDSDGNPAKLDHAVGDLHIQIASQTCGMPSGLRWQHDVYYAFVKRGDGWWRSAPLWQWNYNDKYENGTMVIKWNDQPGRTFAGIAAGLWSLACEKNGHEIDTIEMMLRIEPGSTTPIVYAPLVVGERFSREAGADASPAECKPMKQRFELTEAWSSADDLELAGSATWFALRPIAGTAAPSGLLDIILDPNTRVPSSAGRYRFTR